MHAMLQVFYHLGHFRNLIYQADSQITDEVAKLNTIAHNYV